MNPVLMGTAAGLIALAIAGYLAVYVRRQDPGTERMRELSDAIYRGAMTFLNREYRTIAVFAAIVAVILTLMGYAYPERMHPGAALTFIFGATLSVLAGNLGMRIATTANARAANRVRESTRAGFEIAFSSGAVMGLSVVGLGLTGITVVFLLAGHLGIPAEVLPSLLFGFSFGASSIALFARVGGGIYTKAADVGADLVGKVEAGIPEDDPRNPAVIADNVGDNVGDVAGMGADLYESYVGSIVATIALGLLLHSDVLTYLPIVLSALGIFSAIAGIGLTRTLAGNNASRAMNTGVVSSSVIMTVLTLVAVFYLSVPSPWQVFGATLAGLIVGIVIGLSTEYYTSHDYSPTRFISAAAETGAATVLIIGISVGMLSTLIPVIAIVVGMVTAYALAGVYGIAIAAVGMLSTLGMSLAMDAYGPVADNAAGIAEMAGLGKEARERAEALDAVGNTTAAIGKGFAIGSAALTALAFFATYGQSIAEDFTVNLLQPEVSAGIFVGALMPFVFSALALMAVGDAAKDMVEEVRRQFREIPGLMEGTAKPDYERCVDISTRAALRKMVLPTLLAVLVPISVGVLFRALMNDPLAGARAVGGVLAGAISTGFLLAVFMANAGGAWDNAKKYIEKGHHGGKGSDAHRAAVVGDTVGDPLKDTAGPSLNILIKLMSVVSLLFAPLFLL